MHGRPSPKQPATGVQARRLAPCCVQMSMGERMGWEGMEGSRPPEARPPKREAEPKPGKPLRSTCWVNM
jgi:hypothetical protein